MLEKVEALDGMSFEVMIVVDGEIEKRERSGFAAFYTVNLSHSRDEKLPSSIYDVLLVDDESKVK